MVLVKILKRRDGSSIVVGVAVGLILFTLVSSLSQPLAQRVSTTTSMPYSGWKNQYLVPLVNAALELIALEILGWVYVLAAGSMNKK